MNTNNRSQGTTTIDDTTGYEERRGFLIGPRVCVGILVPYFEPESEATIDTVIDELGTLQTYCLYRHENQVRGLGCSDVILVDPNVPADTVQRLRRNFPDIPIHTLPDDPDADVLRQHVDIIVLPFMTVNHVA